MYDLFANGVQGLDDGKRDQKVRKDPTPKEKELFACSCGFMVPRGAMRCPACGKERPPKLSLVEQVDGEMVALKHSEPKPPSYLVDRASVFRQLSQHALDRKKGDIESARKFALKQYHNIYKSWPLAEFSTSNVEPPHPMLIRKVQQGLIAWAKRRAA